MNIINYVFKYLITSKKPYENVKKIILIINFKNNIINKFIQRLYIINKSIPV